MNAVVETESRGAVRVITLNRPERLNAITPALVEALNGALGAAAADDGVRVIVLRGAGRAFCSGDDLKDFDQQAADAASVRRYVEAIQETTRRLVLGPKPVVGAIHGWAVGGGLEWAIDCDFPIWAEGTRAFFPEIGLGLFVTGAVTTLLPKLVGLHKAKELILFGERFDAAEAARLGLAWRVVAADRLLHEAFAVADRIAALPPLQVRDLKRVANRACHLDVEGAVALETEATVRAFSLPETAERIAAFDR